MADDQAFRLLLLFEQPLAIHVIDVIIILFIVDVNNLKLRLKVTIAIYILDTKFLAVNLPAGFARNFCFDAQNWHCKAVYSDQTVANSSR